MTDQEPYPAVCYACSGAGYFDGGPMRDDEKCSHCDGTGLEPEVAHTEVAAPMPHSWKCSCGEQSIGIEADPALYSDHLRTVGQVNS